MLVSYFAHQDAFPHFCIKSREIQFKEAVSISFFDQLVVLVLLPELLVPLSFQCPSLKWIL